MQCLNVKIHLVPHLQNSLLYTYSFLFLFLDAPPSETVIDKSQDNNHSEKTSQDGHYVVGSCWRICSEVLWSKSSCGKRQTGVVIALRFAYRCHTKCVVGVRLQLVHFDQILLSSKRHDIWSKTLVILRENKHFTVWSWDLYAEGSHVLWHRMKPYRNLMAVSRVRSGWDVWLVVQTLIWVVQSHPWTILIWCLRCHPRNYHTIMTHG